jgi:hypothetical protein
MLAIKLLSLVSLAAASPIGDFMSAYLNSTMAMQATGMNPLPLVSTSFH